MIFCHLLQGLMTFPYGEAGNRQTGDQYRDGAQKDGSNHHFLFEMHGLGFLQVSFAARTRKSPITGARRMMLVAWVSVLRWMYGRVLQSLASANGVRSLSVFCCVWGVEIFSGLRRN